MCLYLHFYRPAGLFIRWSFHRDGPHSGSPEYNGSLSVESTRTQARSLARTTCSTFALHLCLRHCSRSIAPRLRGANSRHHYRLVAGALSLPDRLGRCLDRLFRPSLVGYNQKKKQPKKIIIGPDPHPTPNHSLTILSQ